MPPPRARQAVTPAGRECISPQPLLLLLRVPRMVTFGHAVGFMHHPEVRRVWNRRERGVGSLARMADGDDQPLAPGLHLMCDASHASALAHTPVSPSSGLRTAICRPSQPERESNPPLERLPPSRLAELRVLWWATEAFLLPPSPRAEPLSARPSSLPCAFIAVYLGGTDRLPGALCRVRRVGCEPLAQWAAVIPEFPLTEVSGREEEAQEVAPDPPRFPSKSGRSGRFGRTVRPRSAGPTGADRADRPSEAAQRVGGSHPFGWRLRGTRVVSGALMISLGRVRASAGAAASVPPGGTRRDDLWRDRAGFRSGSLALSGPARGTSGRIGGQWDALATSCVRGEVGRRRRAGSGRPGCRGGPGRVRGGRGDFRSPRVPSGPGGPPPQD